MRKAPSSIQNWKTKHFMGWSLPTIRETSGGLTEDVQEGQAKQRDSPGSGHH